ncbi:MAG: hydrogenase maturation nickel metallochaperone HypA [Thermacetogeniaceae bacterium]
MHEYSMVDGIVRQLRASAAENNIKQISRVALVVGKLTMAVPDALQFSFEAFRKEEPLLKEDAVLEIREEPVMGECKDCQHRFEIKDYEFICPSCSGVNIKLVSGRELYIEYYEGE